jgi:uncharacterized protein YjbI with pentapeptide repeats
MPKSHIDEIQQSQSQQEALQKKVDDLDMSFGPINKNKSTIFLEQILTKVAEKELTDFNIYQSENLGEHLIMSFKEGDKDHQIDLTLLLSQVNMTHFDLSDETIVSLHETFIKSTENRNNAIENNAKGCLKDGCYIYTDPYKAIYRLINNMFRGEKIIIQNYSFESALIAGIFTNIYCSKLGLGIKEKPQNKDKEASLSTIDQQNNQKSQTRTLYRYESRPIKDEPIPLGNYNPLLSLTSTTSEKNNSAVLSTAKEALSPKKAQYSTTYHTQDNRKNPIPSLAAEEKEKTFPQGTQMVQTTKWNPKSLEVEISAQEVSSPDFETTDDYPSLLALKSAYEQFLSKHYKEESGSEKSYDGIPRPNHGLAHSYRVMVLIPIIAKFFGKYAQDEKLREFCQNLSYPQEQLLKAAAAFSVTGRESEIGFMENPEKYKEYKQASRKNFEKYQDQFLASLELQDRFLRKTVQDFKLKSTLEDSSSEEVSKKDYEDCALVVENCGNPEFVAKDSESSSFAQCLYYILSYARNLDLMRCYGEGRFSTIIKNFRLLCNNEGDLDQDLENLIRYADNLLLAHGNRRTCQSVRIKNDVEISLPQSSTNYTKRFLEVSTYIPNTVSSVRSVVEPRMIGETMQEPETLKMDFDNTDIKYVKSLENLKGQQLQNRYLVNINLINEDLSSVNFTGADLTEAKLAGADLTEAKLIMAILRKADLTEADLRGAILRKADLKWAILRKADLTEADLRGAILRKADLTGADLTEADLRWADLRWADLTKADLTKADLTEADLRGVNLKSKLLLTVNLTGADLRGADLTEAYLIESDLRGAKLTGADLTEAYLIESDLTRAKLSGVKLTGVKLIKSNLTKADLTKADLTKAKLTGADLTGADLAGADLREADLREADLRKANLAGADLTGADLRKADLAGADFTETKLTDIKIDQQQIINYFQNFPAKKHYEITNHPLMKLLYDPESWKSKRTNPSRVIPQTTEGRDVPSNSLVLIRNGPKGSKVYSLKTETELMLQRPEHNKVYRNDGGGRS